MIEEPRAQISDQLPVTYADIVSAAARIEGVAHRTPVMTSTATNRALGIDAFFKCENFQRTGAFKFRGAYNAIASLSGEERRRGVVAYSSGNHAQAMAFAGQLLRTATTIVMPKDAPTVKIEATRRYGGEVLFYDRYTESREEIGRSLAAEKGLSLIPPYDHPFVIAGQGTATKELIEDAGPLDRLFVCLGGAGCWPAPPWPPGNSRRIARSSGSSLRPATTVSSRFGRVASFTLPRRVRSPTAQS